VAISQRIAKFLAIYFASLLQLKKNSKDQKWGLNSRTPKMARPWSE